MKHRETVLSTVLAVVCLATPALGQPASAGRAPDGSPAPRTSWGTPDLTGVWDHGTATPLERPERYEGREFLTAEEIAEANVNATTFATSERRGELSAERDVGLAYNQFWWDRGLSDGRTARIVDPPDGRVPERTAAADERGEARRAARRSAERSENPEDRSLWERCRGGSSRLMAADRLTTPRDSGWAARGGTGKVTRWWSRPAISRDRRRGAVRART